MKLFTRSTDYAIRAVSFLAKRKKEKVPASEMVKELGIPRPFLRKILQALSKRRIIKSYKGSGGGFKTLFPAERMSIVDIAEIFQGNLKMNECFFRKSLCPNRKRCVLKKKLDKIEKYVMSELKAITIDELIKR